MIVGERLMICRLTLRPRVDTPVHSHPHEQMTVVERGRVRFTIAGSSASRPPASAHIPPNVAHGATMLDEEVVLDRHLHANREDFPP